MAVKVLSMWLRWMRGVAALSHAVLGLALLSGGCRHEVVSPEVGADSIVPDLVCNQQVQS